MGGKLIHWVSLFIGYLITLGVYVNIPSNTPLDEDAYYNKVLEQERDRVYKEYFQQSVVPERTKELIRTYRADQYLKTIKIDIDEELIRWQDSMQSVDSKRRIGLIQYLYPGVTRNDALLVGQFLAGHILADSVTNFSIEIEPFVFEREGNSIIFKGDTPKYILDEKGDDFKFVLLLMIDSDLTGIKDDNDTPLMMYYDESGNFEPGMIRIVKDSSFIAELISSEYLQGVRDIMSLE